MDYLSHAGLKDCNQCLFKSISCQYVKEDEFAHLQKSSSRLHFNKGEQIMKQGAKATHLIFLQHGIVKFSMEDPRGKNLILTITRAPAMIGGINVFNEGVNLFSVHAIEDCDICFIDYGLLRELLLNNSPFLMKLIEMITVMFRNSILNFISLAHKQVNGRIADILLYLSEQVYRNAIFTLSLTRKEIAEFAGCSTENVIHTLSKFHKDNIILLSGKRIEIIDPERLRTISKVG
jgi:CRP/FNR family transcriptional regulator